MTEKNKIGPYLKGVFGRKAGAVAGFSYSNAMKSSGIVWNEDKLKAFVANPKALVPGTKMTFVGLKKQDEIDDLIAYLKTATK
jgi:cytochrome c